jgi:hypothetical protein
MFWELSGEREGRGVFVQWMSAFARVRPDIDGNIDMEGQILQLRDPSIISANRCVCN